MENFNKVTLYNDVNKIQKLFSGRLYQDKYTFIQEIVSNAKDSHTRAGQERPVEVILKKDNLGEYWFFVNDYGTGLTPKEFEDKIGRIAYSDKEENNNEIGKMGIGSISWAAFHNECKFLCRKDGREFTAIMKETEDEGIIFNITNEKETDLENGVIFSIKVNWIEKNTIVENIYQKLAYFTNVWFEILGDVSINETIKVLRHEDFQVSSLYRSDEVHLTLDDVVYPINWAKLGINKIETKLALRFEAKEGIEPTVTRESLIYNETTITKILEKLEKVSDYIIEKWNNEFRYEKSLFRYIDKITAGYNQSFEINGFTFHAARFSKNSQIPVLPIACPENLKIGQYVQYLPAMVTKKFSSGGELSGYGKLKFLRSYHQKIYIGDITKGVNYISEGVPRKVINHLKSIKQSCLFLRVNKLTLKDYKQILHLKQKPKSEWREEIKNLQEIENLIISKIPHVNSIVIPENSSTNVVRRKKARIEKLEGEIGLHFIRRANIGYGTAMDENVIALNSLKNQKKLHVYSKDRIPLDSVLRKGQKHVVPILVNDKKFKILESINVHNFISLEKFKKHRMFAKFMTSEIINDFLRKNRFLTEYKPIIGECISKTYAENISKLEDYVEKYPVGYISNSDFIKEMLKYANENKIWDLEIKGTLDNVQQYPQMFEFVKLFAETVLAKPSYRKPIEEIAQEKQSAVRAIHDICKQRKIKMDYEHYGQTEKQSGEHIKAE